MRSRAPLSPRRSKYGNRRVRLPGEARSFDSQHEADTWVKLKVLESRGLILGLARQFRFPIVVNGVRICVYVADFVFDEIDGIHNDRRVVADAKGYRTPEYKIKKALMKAIHGIDIREL